MKNFVKKNLYKFETPGFLFTKMRAKVKHSKQLTD